MKWGVRRVEGRGEWSGRGEGRREREGGDWEEVRSRRNNKFKIQGHKQKTIQCDSTKAVNKPTKVNNMKWGMRRGKRRKGEGRRWGGSWEEAIKSYLRRYCPLPYELRRTCLVHWFTFSRFIHSFFQYLGYFDFSIPGSRDDIPGCTRGVDDDPCDLQLREGIFTLWSWSIKRKLTIREQCCSLDRDNDVQVI